MRNFLVIIFFISSISLWAQKTENNHFNLKNGLAVNGYDLVSYFKDEKPKKGNENFKVSYKGVTYLFSSLSNKNEFLKNTEAYLPQYGGWCAYAMGEHGKKVEIDPQTYKILNGKLFLFYNKYFNNTLDSWNENENYLLKKANENWANIIAK